jgi:IS30 family transposase
MSVVEKERVWALWRTGKSLRAVARAIGCGEQQLRRYVWSTGGVRPATRRRAARCLSVAEREEISRGLARGDSCRQIGAALGRSHTTVSREVKLNGGRDRYRALNADRDAWQRARRPKPAKLATSPMLRAVVEHKLELRWSPQQIAGWLSRTYPDCEAMRISHETIYLSLFVQSRGALRRELTAQLRRGHTTRRPHGCVLPQGRGQIKDKLMISARPAEADDRAVPGHWEGDLLLGKLPSAIVTLVERCSRFTQLVALPNGRKGEQVRVALVASIATLPEQLRRSLTWDQGHEMAQHAQFSIDSGVSVYFCDPRSPWQRATAENTNGLLRQYFPRNTDIAVTQAHLDAVAAELNGRPRKTLGWMTPAEKLAELTAAV